MDKIMDMDLLKKRSNNYKEGRTQKWTQNVMSDMTFMTLVLDKKLINSIKMGWYGCSLTPETGVQLPVGLPILNQYDTKNFKVDVFGYL